MVFQNIGWNRSIKVTFIAIQAYNYLFEFISWDWLETNSPLSVFFSLIIVTLAWSSYKTLLSEYPQLLHCLRLIQKSPSNLDFWYINKIVVITSVIDPSSANNLSFSIIIALLKFILCPKKRVWLFFKTFYCHSNVSYVVVQSSIVYFFSKGFYKSFVAFYN